LGCKLCCCQSQDLGCGGDADDWEGVDLGTDLPDLYDDIMVPAGGQVYQTKELRDSHTVIDSLEHYAHRGPLFRDMSFTVYCCTVDVVRVAGDAETEDAPEPHGEEAPGAGSERRPTRKLFARFEERHPLHDTNWRQRMAPVPRVPVYAGRGCPPWPGLGGKASDRTRWAAFIMANLVPWHHGAIVDVSWDAYVACFETDPSPSMEAPGEPPSWTELSARAFVRRLQASSLPDKPNQTLVHAVRSVDRKRWGVPHSLDIAVAGDRCPVDTESRIAAERMQGMVLYQAVLQKLQEQVLASVLGVIDADGTNPHLDIRGAAQETDTRLVELQRLWAAGFAAAPVRMSGSGVPPAGDAIQTSDVERAHILPGMYDDVRFRYVVPLVSRI